MDSKQRLSFIELVRAAHKELNDLQVIERVGESWSGMAITLPPPLESDLVHGLDIEEIGNEITISLDHSHIHLEWPPVPREANRIWWDALAFVDAVFDEKVLASSGWINGELRVGSFHEADAAASLHVPALQYIRTRSWRGSMNEDRAL